MSYTFSRRAFFKYSAAAVVAAAGASLLGGCSAQDPYNPKSTQLGQGIEIMQIVGRLETFDMETGAFKFSAKSNRTNPVQLNQYCFAVKVLDENGKAVSDSYYDGDSLHWTVESGFANRPYLKKNDSATLNFTIDNFVAVQPGQSVVVQYIPVIDQTNYSMIWQIKNTNTAE